MTFEKEKSLGTKGLVQKYMNKLGLQWNRHFVCSYPPNTLPILEQTKCLFHYKVYQLIVLPVLKTTFPRPFLTQTHGISS
jgi:hypothetical protein